MNRWMLTFGDLLTLVVCTFICHLSVSDGQPIDSPEQIKVGASEDGAHRNGTQVAHIKNVPVSLATASQVRQVMESHQGAWRFVVSACGSTWADRIEKAAQVTAVLEHQPTLIRFGMNNCEGYELEIVDRG